MRTCWSSADGPIPHLRFAGMKARCGKTSKQGGEEDGLLFYTPPGEISGGQPLRRQKVGAETAAAARFVKAMESGNLKSHKNHLLHRPVGGRIRRRRVTARGERRGLWNNAGAGGAL